MKNASPRMTTRRNPTESPSAAAGAIELREDRLVIRLPDFRLLQLVARSVLLTAAILTFPWIRGVILSAGMPPDPPLAGAAARSLWVDDPFFLPMLLRDLQRQGLLGAGARAVFLGDPGSRLSFLKHNQIEPVSSDREWIIPDRSVEFVLSASDFSDASFEFIDRVLRVGGITAVRLSSNPSHSFHLPPNYRMVYIRRFGSTIVAIKKIAHAKNDDDENAANFQSSRAGRRLLAISTAKEEMLNELEDVLLELPSENESEKLRRTKYLPDLKGDSLAEHPRRVFVDVGPPGRTGSEKWFQKQYPKGNSAFEIIRLDAVGRGKEAVGISEWLARNVKEEEYVVMKADTEVVEETLNGRTIGLVDELFLECKNQWQNGKRTRTYWECLALYGRLRDQGVAVHQWWG